MKLSLRGRHSHAPSHRALMDDLKDVERIKRLIVDLLRCDKDTQRRLIEEWAALLLSRCCCRKCTTATRVGGGL